MEPTATWTHEWASTMLFDAMLLETPEIPIERGSQAAAFIQCLIEGTWNDPRMKDEKRFLFDIVNNSRNSIDVDKIDYI